MKGFKRLVGRFLFWEEGDVGRDDFIYSGVLGIFIS